MACGVCLEDDVQVINIFTEEGIRLKISSIIEQHFWFQPSEGDPILSQICCSCWEQIANFHIFYTTVKEAHKRLKESYYKKQIDDEELIYTIDDSDEEEANVKDIEPKSDDLNGPRQGDIRNPLEEQGQTCSGSTDGVQLFFKQEHEALLEQYTYIEASNKDIADDEITDSEEISYRSSGNEFSCSTVKEEPDDTIWEQDIPSSSRLEKKTNLNRLFRKQTRSKISQIEEKERTKNEDDLIATHINLECEQCFVKLDTFNDLNRHYQAAHNISGYVRCCDKKLPSRSYILDHINQHINPESYKCKECNKSFSTQYAIKNHLAIKHAPESSKIFKCKECPQRFTNDYSLNKHLLEHKNDDEKRLYCTDCRKMFSSIKALEVHREVHHKRLSGHICHVCGIILKGKKAFGKHIREHAAILGSEAINDPVCPICGKLSASIKTLRHHIRYVHSAMRPHKCPVCGKGFKIRQKLKEHMGTHAVGISLPCPYCPKRFRSKIHVYSHKYRMHKKEYDMERNARLEAAANGTYNRFELSYDPTVNVCSKIQQAYDLEEDDCYLVS